MRNDSLKNKENLASDDEESPTDSESSSDKGGKSKEKVVAPISGKHTVPE